MVRAIFTTGGKYDTVRDDVFFKVRNLDRAFADLDGGRRAGSGPKKQG
jgi:hypothetical protein